MKNATIKTVTNKHGAICYALHMGATVIAVVDAEQLDDLNSYADRLDRAGLTTTAAAVRRFNTAAAV